MSTPFTQEDGNEELWHTIFQHGHPDLAKQHWLHRKLPQKPRCRICLVPFQGIGGWWMRRKGKQQNSRNPNFCSACDQFLQAFPGGAEIDMSLLYVDIRHSTEYAEDHEAAAVSQRVNAFLNQAIALITDHDGFVMAFYGDCIVSAWPPGFVGPDHAQKAQAAAKALIGSNSLMGADGSPIPVGVGVHSGKIYIATVSALGGTFRDISVFGKGVNLTARLAAQAEAGQVLASRGNLEAAGDNPAGYDSEKVELKGIAEPVEIFKIT